MKRWQIIEAVFECMDCGGNQTITLETKLLWPKGFCDGPCRVRYV